MPTLTPKLGLKKPLGNETVSRAAYNENLDIMDQAAASQADLDAHKNRTDNPHNVTLAQVGGAPASHVGAGGSAHATATGSAAGFMSASDKGKLDSIAAGAAALTSSAPTTQAIGDAAAVGTAATAARADHKHGMPAFGTATPAAETVGDAGAVGTATTIARSDHRHPMPGTATSSAAGFMSAADKAKLDGVAAGAAALTTSTPTTQAIGDSAAVGTATTAARADHKHGMPGFGSPSTQAIGDAASAGSAATVARSDHKHGMPSFSASLPAAEAVGDAGAVGTTMTLSRSDHRHPMPGKATSGADGFMAKEDKAKLDGIPPNPRYLAVDWVNPRVIYSSSTQASNSGSTFNVAKTTTLTLTKDLARIRISFDMWCNISNRPMAWRLKVDTNIVATGTVQYSETPVHVSSTISIVPYTDGASHSVTLECAMSGYIDTWYIDDFVLEAPEILPLF